MWSPVGPVLTSQAAHSNFAELHFGRLVCSPLSQQALCLDFQVDMAVQRVALQGLGGLPVSSAAEEEALLATGRFSGALGPDCGSGFGDPKDLQR